MSYDIVQMRQKLIGHPLRMVPSEHDIRPLEIGRLEKAGRTQ